MDQRGDLQPQSAAAPADGPFSLFGIQDSTHNPRHTIHNVYVGVLPPETLDEELEKRKTRYTGEEPKREREEAWSKTSKIVQQYSDAMIKRWNAEIDTYLVFAGLLSAVITAFNVESYLLLQPTTPDPTLLALQQISLQLSSFSTGPPPVFVNSTHPALQQSSTSPSSIPGAAIWLNTLWFSSLILSVSSAFVGIMIKQWLNEYTSGIASADSEQGSSRQTARLRQYRLNNLIKWHAGDIVNSIPVLLQVAMALFLAGLLVLLWTLHSTVAAISTVLAGLLVAFTLSTAVLPSIKPGCAYLSPQSLALYRILCRGPSFVKVSLAVALNPLSVYLYRRNNIMRTPLRGLAKALSAFRPAPVPTWRGIEQSTVSKESQSLDADIICTAYDAAMNPDLLMTAAACLSGLDPNKHVVDCIERLQNIDENHFGVAPSQYISVLIDSTSPVIFDLWADSLLCRCKISETKLELADSDARLYLYFDSPGRLPSDIKPTGLDRALKALALTAAQHARVDSSKRILYRTLLSMRAILAKCNRSRVSLGGGARYAVTVAAHQLGLSEGPPNGEDASQFCMYLAAVNILLECICISDVSPTDPLPNSVYQWVDHLLFRLMSPLRTANYEGLATSDHAWYISFVVQLSGLVNIATEEPAFPVQALLLQDRISALEHAIVALQDARRRFGRPEDDRSIRNRAGNVETLEDKLVRLRAIRSRYYATSASQEDNPQPEANVPSASAPVPVEPSPAYVPTLELLPAFVLVGPPPSILIQRPPAPPSERFTSASIVEPPAPIATGHPPPAPASNSSPPAPVTDDRPPMLRAFLHHGIPNEPRASPESPSHHGVSDGSGDLFRREVAWQVASHHVPVAPAPEPGPSS